MRNSPTNMPLPLSRSSSTGSVPSQQVSSRRLRANSTGSLPLAPKVSPQPRRERAISTGSLQTAGGGLPRPSLVRASSTGQVDLFYTSVNKLQSPADTTNAFATAFAEVLSEHGDTASAAPSASKAPRSAVTEAAAEPKGSSNARAGRSSSARPASAPSQDAPPMTFASFAASLRLKLTALLDQAHGVLMWIGTQVSAAVGLAGHKAKSGLAEIGKAVDRLVRIVQQEIHYQLVTRWAVK